MKWGGGGRSGTLYIYYSMLSDLAEREELSHGGEETLWRLFR